MIPFGYRHVCTIQRRIPKQRASFSGGAGTPVEGQTVTGADSLNTGVVDSVAAGYVVLRFLSGTLRVGEVISTTTWSGTLTAVADHKNQSKETLHYFEDEQIGVACKVYYPSGKGYARTDAGEVADKPLKCALPPSAALDTSNEVYRIKVHSCEVAGLYDVVNPIPIGGMCSLDHYEMVLRPAK